MKWFPVYSAKKPRMDFIEDGYSALVQSRMGNNMKWVFVGVLFICGWVAVAVGAFMVHPGLGVMAWGATCLFGAVVLIEV